MLSDPLVFPLQLMNKKELELLLEKTEEGWFSQESSSLVLQQVSLEQQELLLFLKEKQGLVDEQDWDESEPLWILQKKQNLKKMEKLMKMKKDEIWIEDQCVDVDVEEFGFVSGLVLGQELEQEVCFLRWRFLRWG